MSQPIPKKDLLIEIGLEELPPCNLPTLSNSFIHQLTKGFKTCDLVFDSIEGFVAPRRLAVRIHGLSIHQPEQHMIKKGPAKTAAFDSDGNPTEAALGFASACHTTVEALQLQETNKGAFLVFEQTVAGALAESLIPDVISESLATLPLPKRMRWNAGDISFIRPIHWIVLLFGDAVIPAEILGVSSGKFTRGHRFHHPDPLKLNTPSEYETVLKNTGKVVAHYETRKNTILAQLHQHAPQLQATALIDPALLDQVTGLVEWPVVLVGTFKENFLKLPAEALISAMQVHQKCFPMIDANQKLLPYFLIVSNIESNDPQTVIQGNECVMHARLSDAQFYYDIDKKTTLHERINDLKTVVFQHGLGTLFDKSHRIHLLANTIRNNLSDFQSITASDCERTALLCKTDLLTQMVSEFPELQGIMGRYYAVSNRESTIIADAIEEHYHPRFAQDTIPTSMLGSLIALADKIDTLVGLFGSGKRPTGEKDPFALRRHAMSILRIIIEKKLNLDLEVVFKQSLEIYGAMLPNRTTTLDELISFCFDRLRAWYQEQGIAIRVFEAVLAKRSTKPFDFNQRLLAVTHFQSLPEAESLSAANKRVGNLITKNDAIAANIAFDLNCCRADEEKELGTTLINLEAVVTPLLKEGHYTEALKSLSTLKNPIDRFFDKVMVMVDDSILRNNRFALLARLRKLFLEIADISIL